MKKSDCYTKKGHCKVKAGRRAPKAKRAPSAAATAKRWGVSESDIKDLRKRIPKGSWISTIEGRGTTRAVSRIVILLTDKRGEIYDASFYIANRLGMENNLDRDNGGIKQGGYGLSRSYEIVYRVGMRLWGDGYALKQNRL